MEKIIYISTRQSPLALWQAETTQSLLSKINITSVLNKVVTTGDKIQHSQLADVQLIESETGHHLSTGKGLFIKEVQESILVKQSHLAVHSMKDLPIEQTEGLTIAAVLPRANPRDVLILSPNVIAELKFKASFLNEFQFEELKDMLLSSQTFMTHPIGTTSSRRQFLMRETFSKNLNLNILRGNVDSRLKKVQRNEFAAILLAQAGLERLSLFDSKYMIPLPINSFVPSAAQGVVALECSTGHSELLEVLQNLNCLESCFASALERTVLYFLDGDCNSSIGAHWNENTMHIVYKKNEVEKFLEVKFDRNTVDNVKKELLSKEKTYTTLFMELRESVLAKQIKKDLIQAKLCS